MGYDVSFHPISPEEMREWYFTPLTWIQQGQEKKVLIFATQHGMEDFYAKKYLDTLRVGAGTESSELFDKSHGFYLAVIQGFFRDYYYTRGSSFSFLVEEKPEYAQYFTPWNRWCQLPFLTRRKIGLSKIIAPVCTCLQSRLRGFYGIWSRNRRYRKIWRGLWSGGQLAVLKKALTAAAELGVGLLEATEVVEPNPIHPNESTSYSNLYHCDRDGVYLYMDTVSRQLEDALRGREGQA